MTTLATDSFRYINITTTIRLYLYLYSDYHIAIMSRAHLREGEGGTLLCCIEAHGPYIHTCMVIVVEANLY